MKEIFKSLPRTTANCNQAFCINTENKYKLSIKLIHLARSLRLYIYHNAGKGNDQMATPPMQNVEDPDDSTELLEQTYGVVPLVEFFKDPNHPPLEKTPKDDGYPCRSTWAISQKETNVAIIKQWQKKQAEQSLLGIAYDSKLNYPITSQIETCQFREPAYIVMKKMPPVERFAVENYVAELKDKELAAIEKARFYRNRCDDLVIACKKVEVKALKRELLVRQFWRNSVHEGLTRGGRMVKLALVNKATRT